MSAGFPHQRVLQRREGAVQPNNGGLPSSPTLPPSASPDWVGRVQVQAGPPMDARVWTRSQGAARDRERAKPEEEWWGWRMERVTGVGEQGRGVEQDI